MTEKRKPKAKPITAWAVVLLNGKTCGFLHHTEASAKACGGDYVHSRVVKLVEEKR